MKILKTIATGILVTSFAAGPYMALAAESKTKPYTLDKCVVSGEKIGADPSMKPYVFTSGDREIKLCCKSCLKDFNKDKAKYIKKIEEAEKAKK